MDRQRSFHKTWQPGYTLIELLLVVAIITVLTGVSAPIYEALNNNNGLDVTTNSLIQDLYQAQIFSRSQEHDSAWGVAVNGQTLVLYAGTSYASRNSAYDSVYAMPTSTTISGLSEVDFSKLYGLPGAPGTFTLKSGVSSRSVTINSKGMVDY